MKQILLGAIFLSILAMFFEGYIVFKNLKNKLHAYLFLNCVVMIVNNIGYLLQLVSKTEDAYIAALKFFICRKSLDFVLTVHVFCGALSCGFTKISYKWLYHI